MQKMVTKTAVILLFVSLFMFGFSFALSPLYNTFCKTTGLNTAINIAINQPISPDYSRQISIQFLSTNNSELPWDFYPLISELSAYPDQTMKVIFFAKNKTRKPMTVQAIPSYAPSQAAQFFHKIECFCFNKQTLQPGQSVNMPVVFRIDKKIPKDIQAITLAYTLFDVTPKKGL